MQAMMSLASRAVIEEDASVRNAMVLTIGRSGQLLNFVEWQRALLLLSAGQAYVIETVKRRLADGTIVEAEIRSPSTTVPLPLIIGLMPHINVPAVAFMNAKTERAGRIAVLRRDGGRCTYCGGKGRTIDHIFPKSRGGPNTWQNLVTACADCNTGKANRTPEEAGMSMLFDPRVFEGGAADLQAEVWQFIDRGAGVVR